MNRIKAIAYILIVAIMTMTIRVNAYAMDQDSAIGTILVQAEQGLNIRTGAGADYDALGKIPNGTQLETTGMENGWYKISYNGLEGYVSADYVTFEAYEIEEETIEEPVWQEDSEEIPEVGEETSIDFKKLFILVAIIVVVLLVIVATIASIKRMDDEYDDDDDDEYYDDDEYDDDEYDDDDDEYYDDDEYDDEDEEEYEYVVVRKPKQSTKNTRTASYNRAPQQPSRSAAQRRRDDDFLIDIDPKYFK